MWWLPNYIKNRRAEPAPAVPAQNDCSIGVGHGLTVYGSIDAIIRVQQYMLLDSTHPREAEDVRRSLARSLRRAEDQMLTMGMTHRARLIGTAQRLMEAAKGANWPADMTDDERVGYGKAMDVIYDEAARIAELARS